MMTAEQLGLTEAEHGSLVATLSLLECGELPYLPFDEYATVSKTKQRPGNYFNMSHWQYESPCGTVCCMGGTAERLGGGEGLYYKCWKSGDAYNHALDDLFFPKGKVYGFDRYDAITVAQAARALRNYLDTGRARWQEVLS